MPQHAMKTRQVTPVAGTKNYGLIGAIYNTSGVKQGALKIITKAQSNAWPGSDWTGTIQTETPEELSEEDAETQSTNENLF